MLAILVILAHLCLPEANCSIVNYHYTTVI